MHFTNALDFLKTRIRGNACRDVQITLEQIVHIILRAGTADAMRWAAKIEAVVAFVEAGNYAFTYDNARKILNKRKYSTWILCDDDSMQYAQKLSDGQYRLIQLNCGPTADDGYEVYTDIITLADYIGEDGAAGAELASILKSYGYADVQQVREEYGAAADQIMCGCVFESLIPTYAGEPCHTGTREECSAFIAEYIKRQQPEGGCS